MTSYILVEQRAPQAQSDTPSSHGNFDTAACADAFATRMKNMTAPMGSICRDLDSDRSNGQQDYPVVFDRPY